MNRKERMYTVAQIFLNFMRFFGNFWLNHMLATPPTENPGSAPGISYTPRPSANKAAHSGFETQSRRHLLEAQNRGISGHNNGLHKKD